MKISVSIPDDVFAAAERTAETLGLSRSVLYARAVGEFVDRHDDGRVTELLHAVYAEQESTLDPHVAAIQFLSLDADEEW